MMSKTHYFTISNVKDMLAATLSSPGEIGVVFSAAASIERTSIGIGINPRP
jgi:hypothetical protein